MRSFEWSVRSTQVKFLSCCYGFEKNKFQGLWQCICDTYVYMLVQQKNKNFTAIFFQDWNRVITCCFLLLCLGEFIHFGYVRINTKSTYFQHIQIPRKIKGMMLWTSGTVLCSSSFWIIAKKWCSLWKQQCAQRHLSSNNSNRENRHIRMYRISKGTILWFLMTTQFPLRKQQFRQSHLNSESGQKALDTSKCSE